MNLRELPKFRDNLSYLYVDHVVIKKENHGLMLYDKDGKTPVPISNLAVLFVGNGVNLTSAVIKLLAENGVLCIWSGEHGVRYYAHGLGRTRKATNLLHQAKLSMTPELHQLVVLNMYEFRFGEELDVYYEVNQIRGMEGKRMQQLYKDQSERTGVEWNGRAYSYHSWSSADPINRAISAANTALYGITHAAIVIAGFSPALGFIHTGSLRSFVFDIADLYKAEITVPLSFDIVQESTNSIERRVRYACRDYFHQHNLLKRIIPDITKCLDVHPIAQRTNLNLETYPDLQDLPDQEGFLNIITDLWDPYYKSVKGGQNYGD